MQKNKGKAGIKRAFRGKFYSHPEGLVSRPNHRKKADGGFATGVLRAEGIYSILVSMIVVRVASLPRRLSSTRNDMAVG